jgi:hypothetical protein
VSINHRAEALRLVDGVMNDPEMPALGEGGEGVLTTALVHATLARNEEQAAQTADLREALHSLRRRFNDTRGLVAVHIAKGLASREKDRWKAAIELTKALDEAHCNVDELVDARLSDDGWDPRSAYKTPAALVPRDDPWAPTPDITADVPERVRRVLVEYLAAALLSKGDAQGVAQTITFALKHAGADLTGDIEKQISDIALGRDPSDPPF